jgi:hypothetical protein
MPIYWINVKDKGLTSEQITKAQDIADCASAIATYDLSRRAIQVVLLDGHSKLELPELPYGLSYDDSLNG